MTTSHLGYELNKEYSAKDIVPDIDIFEVEKSRWRAKQSEWKIKQEKIRKEVEEGTMSPSTTDKSVVKANKQFDNI